MGEAEALLAGAIQKMAQVGSPEQQDQLRRRARRHTFAQWRSRSLFKVSGVGMLTGAVGGPLGLALEAGDTLYLFSMAGQACYGVGHILGRPVDYDSDIPLILAVWGGAAEVIGSADAALRDRVAIHVGPGRSGAGLKVVGKSVFKAGGKAAAKVAALAAAKLIGKYGIKVGTKWVPFLGSITSGGINWWLVDGLIAAARQYYEAEYIVLDDALGKEIITTALERDEPS